LAASLTNMSQRAARIHCNAFEAFPHTRKRFGVSLGVERKHQAIVVVVSSSRCCSGRSSRRNKEQ
jgi:hypothetical protein